MAPALMVLRRLAVAALAASSGLSCSAGAAPAGCAGQLEESLVNASSQDLYLGLSEREKRAIVAIVGSSDSAAGLCSGTLVAPDWVLTAGHCLQLTAPRVLLSDRAGRVHTLSAVTSIGHPSLDLALLQLEEPVDASDAVALAPSSELGWLGVGDRMVLAGYGSNENGDSGSLQFLTEPLVAIEDNSVKVSGRAAHGACEGDSGGPLLVRGRDGMVEVAGVLSTGGASCVGEDRYVRLDVAKAWLEEVVGDLAAGVADCGGISEEGRCFYGMPLWCSADVLSSAKCGSGQACGWSASARGFRCVDAAADRCAGVDTVGACRGNTATWCRAGQLMKHVCSACQACQVDGRTAQPYCGPVSGEDSGT